MKPEMCRLLSVVCLSMAAAAQSGPATAVHGPWLGVLADRETGIVRPLRGLPGAATVGEAFPLSASSERAWAAPRAGFAVAVTGRDHSLVIVTATGTRVVRNIEPFERAEFSPSGSHAVLYRGSGLLDVLSGLPDAPRRAAEVDLALLPGALTALAVSEDGTVLAACAPGDGTALVFAAARNRQLHPVFSGRQVDALAFVGASRDALIADAGANVIFRLHDALSGAAAVAIAGTAEGVAGPAAIAAASDGRRAVVANRASGKLLLLDLTGGAPRQLTSPFRATGIEPLAGNALFRLTAPRTSKIWVLDADAPEPRLFFVPQGEGL